MKKWDTVAFCDNWLSQYMVLKILKSRIHEVCEGKQKLVTMDTDTHRDFPDIEKKKIPAQPSVVQFYSPSIAHNSLSRSWVLGTSASCASSRSFSSLRVRRVLAFISSMHHPPSPSNFNKWLWNFLREKRRRYLYQKLFDSKLLN